MRILVFKVCFVLGLIMTVIVWSQECCVGQEQVIALNLDTGEVVPSDPEPDKCCRVFITITNPEETCYHSNNGTPDDLDDDMCDTVPTNPNEPVLTKCNDIATAQDVTVVYDRCETEDGKICIPESRVKTFFPKRGELSCPMVPNGEGVCVCSFTETGDDPEPVEITVCSGNACTGPIPLPPPDVDLQNAEIVAVGVN